MIKSLDCDQRVYGFDDSAAGRFAGVSHSITNSPLSGALFRGGADGGGPGALLLDEAGILYGTTSDGGAFGRHGTVFELDKAGKHTVLYSFKGGSDGDTPNASRLARDAAGNLYGTTQNGGSSGPCYIGDGGLRHCVQGGQNEQGDCPLPLLTFQFRRRPNAQRLWRIVSIRRRWLPSQSPACPCERKRVSLEFLAAERPSCPPVRLHR
jgi:uncharacterized repeat protein (TIGR03803 family)